MSVLPEPFEERNDVKRKQMCVNITVIIWGYSSDPVLLGYTSKPVTLVLRSNLRSEAEESQIWGQTLKDWNIILRVSVDHL